MASKDSRPSNEFDRLNQMVGHIQTHARNRTEYVIANFAVFFALFFLIWIASRTGGVLYRAGWHVTGIAVLAGGMVAWLVAVVFYLSRWGQKAIIRVADRALHSPGHVQLAPHGAKHPVVDIMAGVLFGGSIVTCVALGLAGILPDRLMVPVSALYSVPFLLYLFWRMHPIVGPVALLWPVLYAAHAAIMLLVPSIPRTDIWVIPQMFIVTAGYGLLTATIALVYGRYALRKARVLAREESPEAPHG